MLRSSLTNHPSPCHPELYDPTPDSAAQEKLLPGNAEALEGWERGLVKSSTLKPQPTVIGEPAPIVVKVHLLSRDKTGCTALVFPRLEIASQLFFIVTK
jgi:hypothetical protein